MQHRLFLVEHAFFAGSLSFRDISFHTASNKWIPWNVKISHSYKGFVWGTPISGTPLSASLQNGTHYNPNSVMSFQAISHHPGKLPKHKPWQLLSNWNCQSYTNARTHTYVHIVRVSCFFLYEKVQTANRRGQAPLEGFLRNETPEVITFSFERDFQWSVWVARVLLVFLIYFSTCFSIFSPSFDAIVDVLNVVFTRLIKRRNVPTFRPVLRMWISPTEGKATRQSTTCVGVCFHSNERGRKNAIK